MVLHRFCVGPNEKAMFFELVLLRVKKAKLWFYIGVAYGPKKQHRFYNGFALGRKKKLWFYNGFA